MKRRILFIAVTVSILGGCAESEDIGGSAAADGYPDWDGIRQSILATDPDESEFTPLANSLFGMVTSKQPLATAAGNAMLEAGGNAADAAIATAYAISVLRPGMNSIGGRGQILLRTADGRFIGYNGQTKVPASYEAPEESAYNGYTRIGVPGIVASLERLYEEHASLPRATLMAPAIRYAREGYRLLEIEEILQRMVHKQIEDDPGFRQAILRPDGSLRAAGELLIQSQLANTLEHIAEDGADAFYEGAIAQKIAKDVQQGGGFLTEQDLLEYVAEDGRYLRTSYRGYEIHTLASPAGGALVAKSLNILENFELSNMSDGDWAIVMSQALQLAFESNWRERSVEVLESEETKEWAREQAARISLPTAAMVDLEPPGPVLSTNIQNRAQEGRFTTHFVAADCAGMVVSITQTVGDMFGAKVVAPDLGFVYAETMRNSLLDEADDVPGSYAPTSIAPTIITKDGALVMALGAAGGIRIPSGIVQTISRFIDHDMSLFDAERAPRVHPSYGAENRGSDEGTVRFTAEDFGERTWSDDTKAYWEEVGVKAEDDPIFTFGMVNAVAYDGDTGQWTGVADPLMGGAAQGPSMASCAIGNEL
ncbi:MAG: gamma-glutamyltransferase [Pseudomonadota bacterium]